MTAPHRFCQRFLLLAAGLAIAVATVDAAAPQDAPPGRELDLEEAIHMALARNPDILRAREEIRRAIGQIIEVRAEALPRVEAVGAYDQMDKHLIEHPPSSGAKFDPESLTLPAVPTTSGTAAPTVVVVPVPTGDSSAAFFSQPDKTWRVAFEARQLLYSGGQVHSALKIARFTRESAFYDLRDTVDRVISQTRQGFYDVLLARALIRVQEESLRLLEEQLHDQTNRYNAGTVPRFNVLRAEVEVANVRPELIRAKNNYVIAQLKLARTLGADSQPGQADPLPFTVTGEFTLPAQPLTLAAAVETARQRRAFLKSRRQAIRIQQEAVKVALAGYKPRLELAGGYEWHSERFSDDLDNNVNGWFFGLRGSWAIFDGLETHGRVVQAKAQLEQALVAYADAERQVELEVRAAFSKVEEERELIQSQLKVIEQAKEALRLATERLNAGAGTQLDVLDARTALTKARTNELEARHQYCVAVAEFERITGVETEYTGGVDPAPVPRRPAPTRR